MCSTTPPAAPNEGEVWAIGPAPEGAWVGQPGRIATLIEDTWRFIPPQDGWIALDKSTGRLLRQAGGAWAPLAPPDLVNLAGVGINAGFDAVNRLTVAAPATLLNHEGAGHQLKINKATPGDTASLLFQTGWSGRAEMGLAGTDGFAIKVSPDGASWFEALRVSPSGAVVMPERPRARAARAVGATLIDTPTALGFDTLYTGKGGFSLGAAVAGGGETLSFPVSGFYAVTLNISATASGPFTVTLQKNASENVVIVRGGATGGDEVTLSSTAIAYFAAGDDAQLSFTGAATYNLGYGATEVIAVLT